MLGDRAFRNVTDQCFAPVRRIADMDAEGISRQLLSPVPIMLCYWGPAEATAAFASMQNAFIAEVVAQHPERFLGAGTVARSEEHTSELPVTNAHLVCRLLLEKKKQQHT